MASQRELAADHEPIIGPAIRILSAELARLFERVAALVTENARLGRVNDEQCDQIFELQQEIKRLREGGQ